MKGFILAILFTITCYIGVGQSLPSQIQAKRGVFTDRLYLHGHWIDGISTDLNTPDSGSDNLIATAKAVADHIRSKTMPVDFQQVLSAGSTLTQTNIVNGGHNLFVWSNNLSNGNLYRHRIDYNNSQVTNTIYGSDFETLSDLIQSGNSNWLYNSGFKTSNQFKQTRNGGTLILTAAAYTFRESGLLVDTAYLTLLSGYAGGVEHRINIHKDSIQIIGYAGNTNLFLRGLPSSSSISDSTLVKLPDGRLAYRASNIAAGGLWANTDNDAYNTNSGNTGVGINSPTAKLHIRSQEFGTEGTTSYINPIWNTTGNPTALKVNPLVIANGGASLLADFQYSGLPRFSIRHDGLVKLSGYTSGTFTGTPAYDLQINNSGEVIQKVAPKIYTALLSQSGVSDPAAAVLGTNSIGAISWTRTGPGTYSGTLNGAFPIGKTFVVIGDANDYTDTPVFVRAFRADENKVDITMLDINHQPADGFNYVPIEIRVYP
jgi:hypothetical protein